MPQCRPADTYLVLMVCTSLLGTVEHSKATEALHGHFEKRRDLKVDRLEFKAKLPRLLAVLFWVGYTASLNFHSVIRSHNR